MQLSDVPPAFPVVKMYFNPPSPLPKQGGHRIEVRFTAGPAPAVASVHVERGEVSYVTKSTNWMFTERERVSNPELAARIDALTPDLVRAVSLLRTTPPADREQPWRTGNNEFTVLVGENYEEGWWSGGIIGGRDAGDGVSQLLRTLAEDLKSTLPSYTEGPG